MEENADSKERKRMSNKEVGKDLLKRVLLVLYAISFLWVIKLILDKIIGFFSVKKDEVQTEYRRRSTSGRIFLVIKIVITVVLVVIASSMIFTRGYALVQTIIDAGVSPADIASNAYSTTVNATQEGIEQVRLSIMTPLWRQECQRRYLQENPEDMDRMIENCVRQKQGLPPLEEEQKDDWHLRGASNYLDVDVRTEPTDAEYLKESCGERCGIITTTLENSGDRDIQLKDVELYVTGNRIDGEYPLITEEGKTYRLDRFIRDEDPITQDTAHIDDLDEDQKLLRPYERYTMDFLINMTRHRTFVRDEVEEDLEGYREQVNERRGENTTEEYCSEQDDEVYGGENVFFDGEEVVIEENEGYDSFPEFEGQVCKEHVVDAVEQKADWLMGSESITPNVEVNYSSKTESVLNLNIWNTDVWGSMSPDERDSTMRDNCRTIGGGDSLKQTSDLNHDDAVAFLLYSNCRALAPDDEEIQTILDIQVQADDSIIDSFGIDSVEGFIDDESGICDELINEIDPTETFEGGWYLKKDENWDTPTTACYIALPETSSQSTLNLGIQAEYTATVSGSGRIDLN